MARGGTARVTNPNVIWLHFDCECRQVDISRLYTWMKVDFIRRWKNQLKSTLKSHLDIVDCQQLLSAVIGLYKFILLFQVQLVVWRLF